MTSSCILTVNSMWNESKAVFLKKAKKKKSLLVSLIVLLMF